MMTKEEIKEELRRGQKILEDEFKPVDMDKVSDVLDEIDLKIQKLTGIETILECVDLVNGLSKKERRCAITIMIESYIEKRLLFMITENKRMEDKNEMNLDAVANMLSTSSTKPEGYV